MRVPQIVSGAQTGVDRAALDVARELGIPYGGWCPRGGWAEDLTEPPGVLGLYPRLRETPTSDPAERTRWNARDSDATLILTMSDAVSAGTALTYAAATGLSRPVTVVDLDAPDAAKIALAFLQTLPGEATLNVAGARESESRGIYARATTILAEILL